MASSCSLTWCPCHNSEAKDYVVKIGDEYWQKHELMGDWVKRQRDATRFTRAQARTYLKDWKPYGVRVVRLVKR